METLGTAAAPTHRESKQDEWLEVLRAYSTGWSLGDADMNRPAIAND